jgi:hypothetical protein
MVMVWQISPYSTSEVVVAGPLMRGSNTRSYWLVRSLWYFVYSSLLRVSPSRSEVVEASVLLLSVCPCQFFPFHF